MGRASTTSHICCIKLWDNFLLSFSSHFVMAYVFGSFFSPVVSLAVMSRTCHWKKLAHVIDRDCIIFHCHAVSSVHVWFYSRLCVIGKGSRGKWRGIFLVNNPDTKNNPRDRKWGKAHSRFQNQCFIPALEKSLFFLLEAWCQRQ